ncbi:hypothetical protein Trydic_g8997 [Trypoxylus dichotomus]
MMKITAVIVLSLLGLASSWRLPHYLPKCNFTDPDLSDCIKEKANIAIPLLVGGDRLYGIPQLSPLRTLETIWVNKTDFNLTITNLYFDDLKDIRIDNMYFEPKARNARAEFRVNVMDLTADYELVNGVIGGAVFSGSGGLNMTFVNNNISYSTILDHYTRENKVYAKTKNSTVFLNSETASFYFSGLEISNIISNSSSHSLTNATSVRSNSDNPGNATDLPLNDETIDDFISENWEELYTRFKPVMEDLILKYFRVVVDSLHQRVPIKNFFD